MNSKNLAHTIFDQSRDLFWVVDNNYLLLYANKSYQTLMLQGTGTYRKLNDTVFVEGFGEGYTQRWKLFYDRAFKGEYFEIEDQFYHPHTNEIQYGQNTFEPLFDSDNKVYAISCQWKNITRIVKQRSEANQMMDASLDVFCTVDEQGNFVFVSGASELQWGYSPEELIGLAYQSLTLDEDVAKTLEVAATIFSGQAVTTFENRYRKKDGTVAYNSWSARWDDQAKLVFCVARDGKERLEKEEQILLSEQRFKALVQEGSDMIGIIDAEGKYIYVSPTSTAILGFTPEQFQGKNIFEFIHPEDVNACMACVQNIVNENKINVPPFRFLNNKNEYRWLETVLTNMVDNPVIRGIVANSRDITDIINAQKQIETSEFVNKTILENSPDCLKVLDSNGRIQYMNYNGLCQMEIDDFDTVKNKNWWTLWGSENEELVKKALNKALTGETAQFVAYCATAKGTPKWWDVMVSPVGKAGEPILQIISVSRDITEQKKEEQRLKLLESVITHTNDAVLITEAEPLDAPGPKIIYVNEAFTKMTGYTAEEVIGKSPRILQGPHSNKEDLKKLGKALRNWQPYEITTLNYKKNGEEFWINFTVTPVADEKGWFTHWVAIERDVTVQKNKELETELLAQVSASFNALNDYVSAAKNVCKSISKYGEFDLVEVWTTNTERTQIQLLTHYVENHQDEKFYTFSPNDKTYKMSESLVGKVWFKQVPLLWDDVAHNKNFVRRDAAKKIGLEAVLGIPLIFNNETIGVLKIGTKHKADYLNKYTLLFKKLEKFIGSELNRKKLENDLSQLYNSIPDIIGVGDFKGRVLKINKAGCELLGYPEGEILYHSFNEFVHPEDTNIAINKLEELKKGKLSLQFEIRFITKTGSIIWLSWQCSPSLEEGIIYVTAKNITEEKKLRELNREVSKLTKTGSWEVNLIEKSLFWSDEIYSLCETDPNTFVLTLDAAINFYREDFRHLAQSNFEKCIETGHPYEIETIIVTANKKELWVRTTANAEFVEGVCIRVYGSFQDIDTRKKAEQERNSLQETLESSLNEIYIFDDKTFKFSYVNKGALYNLGYSKNEIETLTPLDLKPSFTLTSFKKLVSQLVDNKKQEIVFFTSHKRKNGSLYPVEVHLQLVLIGNQKRYVAIILDITERKKAEDKLIESELKYRLLASQLQLQQTHLTNAQQVAKLGSWETNLKDFTVSWSDETYRIFGMENNGDVMNHEKFLENVHPLDREKVDKALGDSLLDSTKVQHFIEHRIITNTGLEKIVEERWKVDFDETGVPLLSIGSCQDITERKKAEKEFLAVFEERNSILERITEAFISLDANWCYTYMNKKAGEIFSRDPEKMLGKHIWTEFPEGLNQPFHLVYEKAMETQQYIHVEEYYKPYDLWFENHIYPSVDGLSVFFRDVTERKRSEENLRKSNERFEKATEATNDLIWDWDILNDTYYRSQAIERFFGPTANTVLSVKDFWKDSFHPDDINRIKKSIQLAIAEPNCFHWEQEYRIVNLDHPIIYVIDRGIIIRNAERVAIRMVGAMTNITEQKELNLKLTVLNNALKKHALELERSNEELEQFAFIASHDLQEPLRMISSFMDLLKRKYGNAIDAKGHVYIDFAIEGAKKMKQIILDLLDYSTSNKTTDSKEVLNLNEIISDYKLLRRKLIVEKNVKITTDNLPTILSYSVAVTQIFHCLIDNAIKYSGVDVHPIIEISAVEHETYWEFSVKDNGIGIDPQFFSKIFIIFQRLHNKNTYPGTGIGLSITKRHVEFLGGKIWLESELRKGSKFHFTISK